MKNNNLHNLVGFNHSTWSLLCGFIVFTVVCVQMFCHGSLQAADNKTAENKPKRPIISAHQLEYSETYLKTRGISCDEKGIIKYLANFYPTPEVRAKVEKLVEQLGSPIYRERLLASQKLLESPFLPIQQLQEAVAGDDAEIRYRAQIVLDHASAEGTPILKAIFQVIMAKKYSKCIDPVLKTIPFANDDYLRTTAYQTIREVATKNDIETLQKALKSSNHFVKVGALKGLGTVLDKTSVKPFYPFLKPDQPSIVRYASARELANRGDRNCLATLVDLLSEKKLSVTSGSINVLRELCKQNFRYSVASEKEERDLSIAKWKDWTSKQGLTARLHFPLKKNVFGRSYLNGNTLLAYGYKNRVVELDPTGKEVWSYGNPGTRGGFWSAEKLANGNVLIAAYYLNKVIEVNMSKKIVREFNVSRPLNARPLANGNYLICGDNMVKEVDLRGKIVWSHNPQIRRQCCDAQRLANGNTLIASSRGVDEVDRKGKVVWNYPCSSPYGIQALENGNVLISVLSGSRVVEVNRKREIVWRYNTSNPADAFRLPNGNTLITSNSKFLEVDPKGKLIWSKTGCQYGSARR